MYCGRCGIWVPTGAGACPACGLAAAAPVPPRAASFAAAEDGPAPALAPAAAPSAAAVRYGGFWRRFAAGTVDNLLLFFPDAILRSLTGLPSGFSGRTLSDAEVGRTFAIAGVMFVVGWWYRARFESSRRQGTLGQQLLGLRVTGTDGARIGFGRASMRYFAQVLSVMTLGIGYLANLWSPRRQTLHDALAGCLVVREAESPVHVAAPRTEAAR